VLWSSAFISSSERRRLSLLESVCLLLAPRAASLSRPLQDDAVGRVGWYVGQHGVIIKRRRRVDAATGSGIVGQ